MKTISLALVLLSLSLVHPVRGAESVEQTVKFLLDYIAHSDASFIRNGDAHSPAEGVEHVKAKYEHFKTKIKTPEDFIRLSASKSLLSGKPYLVKTKDGKEEHLDAWLTHALEEHRKAGGAR